jgi:UPF0755 protein
MIIRKIFPLILLSLFLLALFANLALFQRFFRADESEVKVRIKRGANLRSVATELEAKEVIFNKLIFIITGRLLGYQDEIIPGEYSFPNGLSNLNILKLITDPTINRSYTVMIPEGLNIRQIGRLLKDQLGLDSAKFVNETFNDSLISLLDIEAENLEGFLFPDTYNFSLSAAGGLNGESEREIVLTMFNNFMKKYESKFRNIIEQEELDLLKIITLASIIEGETRYEPEKKTIAGVYYNRLRYRMRLEADPTVQYVLPDGPKKRLMHRDLKYPSPYNTYLKRGLPPGPINNPGLSSIIAALEPENHRYLYFVAKGDGSHRFAETYGEHKKNIREYKKFLEETELNQNGDK